AVAPDREQNIRPEGGAQCVRRENRDGARSSDFSPRPELRADRSIPHFNCSCRPERIIGIGNADGAAGVATGWLDPEILTAKVEQRAVHDAMQCERRAIERVPGDQTVAGNADADAATDVAR